jgi:hypothetical protein
LRRGQLAEQFAGKGEEGEFDAMLQHFLKQKAKSNGRSV